MRIVMIDMLPSLFDFLSAGVYPDNGISNPTAPPASRGTAVPKCALPASGGEPYGAV